MDCCGKCAHHLTGLNLDDSGLSSIFDGHNEFGGHGNHPNGKCRAPTVLLPESLPGITETVGDIRKARQRWNTFALLNFPNTESR